MTKPVASKPGIYMILNLETNRRYVGSTGHQTISLRFAQHRYRLRKGTHGNFALQRSWDVHGEKAFAFVPLENAEGECFDREQEWYDKFKAMKGIHLYNLTKPQNGGNGGFSGNPHSEKSRRKMSRSHKKRWAKMTAEEKASGVRGIRKYWDGKSPEELGAAVRAGRLKKAMAKEPRQLISPSGEVVSFHHLTDFCAKHGLDRSAITKVCAGKRPSHKGWRTYRG